MKRIGLRRARKRVGLTQERLAALAGIDQVTVSQLETGRRVNPTLNTVSSLAKVLGLEPGMLVFRRRRVPHQPETVAS